ncbi:hypothetical protein P8452_04026 [Trifolium repens]|nr:hypothetical protein P8452_04026 [Trifolium repens]
MMFLLIIVICGGMGVDVVMLRTKITCLTMKVCAIKAHGFGENRKSGLQDLDVLTGGQLITEDLGHNLEKVLFVSAN